MSEKPPQSLSDVVRKKAEGEQNWITEKLSKSALVERLPDGKFRVKPDYYLKLEDYYTMGRHGHDAPGLYAENELFLIALLSDDETSFHEFLENTARFPIKKSKVFEDHYLGKGLPKNVEKPLKNKKVLFIGGGSQDDQLLEPLFSDGALAINVDPASGDHTLDNSSSDYISSKRDSATGETRNIRCGYDIRYNELSAYEMNVRFGSFNALVIQNLFIMTEGRGNKSLEVAEALFSALSLSINNGGLLLFNADLGNEETEIASKILSDLGFHQRAVFASIGGRKFDVAVFEKQPSEKRSERKYTREIVPQTQKTADELAFYVNRDMEPLKTTMEIWKANPSMSHDIDLFFRPIERFLDGMRSIIKFLREKKLPKDTKISEKTILGLIDAMYELKKSWDILKLYELIEKYKRIDTQP